MFAKRFFVFVALLISFVGTVFAQETPEEIKARQEAFPGFEAPATKVMGNLDAKRAAAEAMLRQDVIKMTAYIKDNGGINLSLELRAYPKDGKFVTYRTGSYCESAPMNTKFSITSEGDVQIDVEPRFRGCYGMNPVINPVSRKITVYVTPPEGKKYKTSAVWTLDN